MSESYKLCRNRKKWQRLLIYAFSIPLISLSLSTFSEAQGDLTRKPIALADLLLGSEVSDYSMSLKRYDLKTGQAYKLKVISSGLKEYAIEAPEFFYCYLSTKGRSRRDGN